MSVFEYCEIKPRHCVGFFVHFKRSILQFIEGID